MEKPEEIKKFKVNRRNIDNLVDGYKEQPSRVNARGKYCRYEKDEEKIKSTKLRDCVNYTEDKHKQDTRVHPSKIFRSQVKQITQQNPSLWTRSTYYSHLLTLPQLLRIKNVTDFH